MAYSLNKLGLKVLETVDYIEKGTAVTVVLSDNKACIRPATDNDSVVGIALEDYTRGVNSINNFENNIVSISVIEFSNGLAGETIKVGELVAVNTNGKFKPHTEKIIGVAVTNAVMGEMFQFVRLFTKEGSGGSSSDNSYTFKKEFNDLSAASTSDEILAVFSKEEIIKIAQDIEDKKYKQYFIFTDTSTVQVANVDSLYNSDTLAWFKFSYLHINNTQAFVLQKSIEVDLRTNIASCYEDMEMIYTFNPYTNPGSIPVIKEDMIIQENVVSNVVLDKAHKTELTCTEADYNALSNEIKNALHIAYTY